MSKYYETLRDKFTPGNMEIWYSKYAEDITKDWFMWEYNVGRGSLTLPSNKFQLRKTHNKLGSVNFQNLNEIFYNFQGEIWSPHGEASKLIKKKGLSHTSMSVGDIVVDKLTEQGWIVSRMGFKKIYIKK